MTITEFLTARYDEDEAVARTAMEDRSRWRTTQERSSFQIAPGAGSQGWDFGGGSGMWQCDDPEDGCDEYISRAFAEAEHITRWDPTAVLADIAAKRAIVAMHWEGAESWARFTRCVACGDGWPCQTIRILAQPYAEHPDYDPAWRTNGG